jgi:pilus assembly protein CpaB
MSRSTRTLIVLTLALAVAGGASFMVYRAVQNIPVREVEVRSYFVAVAARPLTLGTMLTSNDVKLVAWPASSPVEGSFSKVEDVTNRGLVEPVVENEPITASKLAPLEAGAGLPPTITVGMRAISVKVNEVIGVAGFVVPGTRVDVIVSVTRAQQTESVSRVVVSNVQVLTAGTKFDQEQAKEGRAVPSTVVTLLVTPEDAERIALASSIGQIMLTLRNPLDQTPTDTKGTRIASLMGAPDPPPVTRVVRGVPRIEKPKEPPAPVPTLYSVETIRAAKRTAEVIK